MTLSEADRRWWLSVSATSSGGSLLAAGTLCHGQRLKDLLVSILQISSLLTFFVLSRLVIRSKPWCSNWPRWWNQGWTLIMSCLRKLWGCYFNSDENLFEEEQCKWVEEREMILSLFDCFLGSCSQSTPRKSKRTWPVSCWGKVEWSTTRDRRNCLWKSLEQSVRLILIILWTYHRLELWPPMWTQVPKERAYLSCKERSEPYNSRRCSSTSSTCNQSVENLMIIMTADDCTVLQN